MLSLAILRSTTKSRFANGWVFSAKEDFAFFYLPLILGLLFYVVGFGQGTLLEVPLFLWFKNLVDMSHVTSTLFPWAQRYRTDSRQRRILLLAPAIVLLVGSLAYYRISAMGFYAAMAYLSIWHIYRQQYGWLMASRAAAQEGTEFRIVDTLFLINLIQYPVIFWHSPDSSILLKYLNDDDLILRASPWLTQFSATVFWTGIVLYGAHLADRWRAGHSLNLGKLSIFFSTWLLYYGGLVYFNDFTLWWWSLGLTHGLPYLWIVYRRSYSPLAEHLSPSAGTPLLRRRFALGFAFLFVVILLAQVWDFSGLPKEFNRENWSGWVFPLFWFPTLMHYFLDGFVWKRIRQYYG